MSMADKPFFSYHWDSAFFWLEVPKELFEKHMSDAKHLNAETKISEDRRTMYLEWQSDGHVFLERFLNQDDRAKQVYSESAGAFRDPRSGAFADFFYCFSKCDGPVSFIRRLPPLDEFEVPN